MTALALVAAALLVAPAGEAGVSPAVVRLVYLTGTGTAAQCPDARDFEEQVAARLGGSPFSELVGTLLVVVLERQTAGYLGRMFVRGADGVPRGERQVRLPSCPGLVRSLAVAAAVLLGAPGIGPASAEPAPDPVPEPAPAPTAAGERSAVVPPPERTAPPPLDPVMVTGAAPSPSPARFPNVRWQLSLAPIVTLGGTEQTQERPAFGAAVAGAMMWPRLSLGAELRVLAPVTEPVGRGQVSTGTVVAVALGCAVRSGVSGCAALSAGAVHAAGQGFDRNYTFLRPYLALGGRVGHEIGGRQSERRFRLRPYFWAEFPLTRWTFTVDGIDVVRRSIVSVGLGLEIVLALR